MKIENITASKVRINRAKINKGSIIQDSISSPFFLSAVQEPRMRLSSSFPIPTYAFATALNFSGFFYETVSLFASFFYLP
jgi:hypothetical protein